ncbi:MAG: hypothetical protein V1707_00725 [bacterium]
MHYWNLVRYVIAQLLRKIGYDFHEADDTRVAAMKQAIADVGGRIEFAIERHPDGVWTAESINIQGIITGGKGFGQAPREIKDAVFTYFGIPPHLCNDALLRTEGDLTARQLVYG